jgi:hypothetical protein
VDLDGIPDFEILLVAPAGRMTAEVYDLWTDEHVPCTQFSGGVTTQGKTLTVGIYSHCLQNPRTVRAAAYIYYNAGNHYDAAPNDISEDFAGWTTVATARMPAGYWMLGNDGNVYTFGEVRHFGNGRDGAVDIEPDAYGNGYRILHADGSVWPPSLVGDVYGLLEPGERAVSISMTRSGMGYWIFTNRGRVFDLGDATFFGDLEGVPLNGPVLDSIPTPSGMGYYMVAADGGVFAFGDAQFHGSMGGRRLNAPVMSLVPDPDGSGYWLVAYDGGIFAFGAEFRGSMGGRQLNQPVTGMVPHGNGYLMVAADGGIFNFSNQAFYGSLGGAPPTRPIVAVASVS